MMLKFYHFPKSKSGKKRRGGREWTTSKMEIEAIIYKNPILSIFLYLCVCVCVCVFIGAVVKKKMFNIK